MNKSSITYKVEYHTKNSYQDSVKNAHWQLLVLPENNKSQTRLCYTSEANLENKQFITPHLFSGDCLSIQVNSAFTNFDLSIESEVKVDMSNPFAFEMASTEEEKEEISKQDFTIDNAYFLYSTKLTQISSEQARKFSIWKSQNLIRYCQELMQELNSHISFSSGETEVNTTASQALKLKKGVCQDFAHILIGLLRKQNIPARYVSGYLCQGEALKGASQLHAWVECFIPKAGWVGLDPSNNLFADHHYIKISHGRSYQDCTPILGVLETGGSNSTSHQVKVSQIQQQ